LIRFFAYIVPLGFSAYSMGQSLKISAGLLPMSEYGLLMLGIGITSGVMDTATYSILVVIFLVVNVLAPMIIGLIFAIHPQRSQKPQRRDRFR